MLETEMRNPGSMHIDTMTVPEMLRVIQDENYNAVRAVEAALPEIAAACEVISDSIAKGGRLIYIGAGTSGRLGVIDATECGPTYGVEPGVVIGIMAGGYGCLVSASEKQEDSYEAGVADILAVKPTENDTVVGISAAGGAQYVHGAILAAKEHGARAVALTCNPDTLIAEDADIAVVTRTGAEVVTGSTRMKAGTAQKLVTNMFSTVAMIKNGKVYENLMINLRATNDKLVGRMKRIVCDILKCDEAEAERRLNENDWDIRKTVGKAGGRR